MDTFQPLTEEQYNGAVKAGFSPQQIIQNEQQRKASYSNDSSIQPSFKATIPTTTAGAFASIPTNMAKMAGNVPSDVAGTIGAAFITPAKNIHNSEGLVSDIYKDRGAVQGTKDIAAGFGQTASDIFQAPGKALVGNNDRQVLLNHLIPIQDATLKQRDLILQKIQDARKNGQDTSHLDNALKYTLSTLDSLNTQIGSKEDRTNQFIQDATNIAKYPIEHPVQTALAVDSLPEGTQNAVSDTLKPITSPIESEINTAKTAVSGAIDATTGKIGDMGTATKNAIKPPLTPEEATGQIIQGKTEDIPSAKKTFENLTDTSSIKTQKDLSNAIDQQIIKPGLKQVDAEFAKDTSGGHSIKSFEQTVGTGKASVKVNYVQDAINQLKDFYNKTGDAQGLSDMKALENKARINGLTYKDVNDLARIHGADLNGFNANGELSSGLSKQAAENTRMGLKTTARNGLGSPEAKALDKKVSDAIQTKDMVDSQVEKVNTQTQKNPKVGAIPKVLGPVVKAVGHPIDTISRLTGVSGAGVSYNPGEIEERIARNLKIIRGE